jgi:hypothetical protein
MLLAAFFALLSLGAMACRGSGNAGAPLGSEAGIQSVTISRGALSPAYTMGVNDYGVSLLAAAETMDVTAVLVDPNARLAINGEAAQDGVPHQVRLGTGQTAIGISALAEDGATSNLVTLTVNVAEPNTKVWVLDSVGGTYPDGARLTLTDAHGAVLEPDIDFPADKNGSMLLGLDPKGRYNIYAKAHGSAQACFANFDRSREDTATLYCLPNWAAPFPAEAPTITDVYFSDQPNSGWEKLPSGTNALSATAAKMQYVKITARARSAITEADWGPNPINIMLDSLAWYNNATPGVAVENATPVGDGGQTYYQSTYRFMVPHLQNGPANKDHWLDMVVYDIANNRTEQRVYLTVTDSAASSLDPSLAQTSPKVAAALAQTYGISMDIPAISPIDPYGAFYFTYLTFAVNSQTYDLQMTGYWDPYMGIDPLDMIDLSGIDMPGVRGFDVWRSDGGSEFRHIDTLHYALLYDGLQVLNIDMDNHWPPMVTVGQVFEYRDTSPDVTEDTMRYKFRAFNGNPANDGYAPFTDAIGVKPLPPFTTKLMEPANGAIVGTTWPTFKFNITNPAICGGGLADEFNFTIMIKPTYYTDAINCMRYLVDFADLDEDGSPRCYNIFDDGWSFRKTPATIDGTPNGQPYLWLEDDGAFVLSTDNPEFKRTMPPFAGEMVPGLTYEWSIFGLNAWVSLTETMTDAAHFRKDYPVPAGQTAIAYSFGSAPLYGLGSPNGFFVLTIDPEAKRCIGDAP